MKIAYGVHGFGRGHAMRARAVLPELSRRHEVLVLAGGDAYHALSADFAVTRIPTLKYHYNRRGRLSNYQNIKRNVSMVLDLMLKGPTFQAIEQLLRDFKPDVVLTDSEAYTHRVAAQLGIPRITFDHFGLLIYCRLNLSAADRLIRWGNAFVYRWLFGEPERAVVSWFADAPTRRPGIQMVGAVIRPEVLRMAATRGDYLLAYVSKPDEFTPQVENALRSAGCPIRIYGTPRRGMDGTLEFKEIANLPFIEDLAGCRGVIATTGNQLCGEVVHFRKPMLGTPMACLEQRLNADAIERMGVGMQVPPRRVTAAVVQRFLAREAEFAASFHGSSRDGAKEALEAIERFAAELKDGNR